MINACQRTRESRFEVLHPQVADLDLRLQPRRQLLGRCSVSFGKECRQLNELNVCNACISCILPTRALIDVTSGVGWPCGPARCRQSWRRPCLRRRLLCQALQKESADWFGALKQICFGGACASTKMRQESKRWRWRQQSRAAGGRSHWPCKPIAHVCEPLLPIKALKRRSTGVTQGSGGLQVLLRSEPVAK